jgi:hypothetical protein
LQKKFLEESCKKVFADEMMCGGKTEESETVLLNAEYFY